MDVRFSNSDPSSHGPREQLWMHTCQHSLKNFTPSICYFDHWLHQDIYWSILIYACSHLPAHPISTMTHLKVCHLSSIRHCNYYFFHFVQLLFAGSICFFGKPADAWYGTYKWDGDNCQMLSVVHTASQSCCQLWNDSYSTNSPNSSVVTIGRNYLRTCSHARYTSWQLLFEHGIYFIQSFWLCDYYSGKVTIGEQHLF